MVKTATSLPYEWLRTIPRRLFDLDTTPLLGSPPLFSWDAFANHLKETFELNTLTVTGHPPEWRTKDHLFNDMGDHLLALNFSIPGMEGLGSWVMHAQDLQHIMGCVFLKSESPFPFDDPDFKEGFIQFLGIEILDAVSKTDFDQTLSPHLEKNSRLPNEDSLTFDITTTFEKHTFTSRLFISQSLQENCKKHFIKGTKREPHNSPLANHLEVELHLEIGHSQLTRSEWSAMQIGDFMILDQCSFQPSEEQGRVLLTSNGTPLFKGRLKKGAIKILEYPLYQEVNTMTNELDDEESVELSLDGESELDFEEELESGPPEVESTPEDMESKDVNEAPEDVALTDSQAPQSPDSIPLNVIVEVGRIKMTIQKLSELEPGNLLDLNIQPESGVDLVVNGRCIAKGELLKVGETLGIRILEIG